MAPDPAAAMAVPIRGATDAERAAAFAGIAAVPDAGVRAVVFFDQGSARGAARVLAHVATGPATATCASTGSRTSSRSDDRAPLEARRQPIRYGRARAGHRAVSATGPDTWPGGPRGAPGNGHATSRAARLGPAGRWPSSARGPAARARSAIDAAAHGAWPAGRTRPTGRRRLFGTEEWSYCAPAAHRGARRLAAGGRRASIGRTTAGSDAAGRTPSCATRRRRLACTGPTRLGADGRGSGRRQRPDGAASATALDCWTARRDGHRGRRGACRRRDGGRYALLAADQRSDVGCVGVMGEGAPSVEA